MPKEKPELSDAMRKKLSGKSPEKNPIQGTKFTIAISGEPGLAATLAGKVLSHCKEGRKWKHISHNIASRDVRFFFSVAQSAKAELSCCRRSGRTACHPIRVLCCHCQVDIWPLRPKDFPSSFDQ